MSDYLTAPLLDVLQKVGRTPSAAYEIGVHPGALVSLAHRGLLRADRKRGHPNIYRMTAKGQALVELLEAPIVFMPSDGMVKRIQKTVAEQFKVPLEEMWSERRSRGVARPRQVAMYLARELTPLSLPNIGRRFGKRDHTTVMHGIKTIEGLIAEDREFASKIAALRRALTA